MQERLYPACPVNALAIIILNTNKLMPMYSQSLSSKNPIIENNTLITGVAMSNTIPACIIARPRRVSIPCHMPEGLCTKSGTPVNLL